MTFHKLVLAAPFLLSPVILPDLPDGYRIEKTKAASVVAGRDVLLTVTRD